jgi:LacI family transcriptional regulator
LPSLFSLDNLAPFCYNEVGKRRRDSACGEFARTTKFAAAVVKSLKEEGWRVPQDVSVVGFDDSPLFAECLDPALTTVRQPFAQLGHVAVQLLRDRMNNPADEPREILLPGEFVVRNSCAPLLHREERQTEGENKER